jgi:hypothetical protein
MRIMDFSYCQLVKIIPDFSRISNCKELTLGGIWYVSGSCWLLLRHELGSKSTYPNKYSMQNILQNRGKFLQANKGK